MLSDYFVIVILTSQIDILGRAYIAFGIPTVLSVIALLNNTTHEIINNTFYL